MKVDEIKKVLIITYYSSPMMAAGAHRMSAFANYLPKFGFQPIVLTTRLNRLTWDGPLDFNDVKTYPVLRLFGAHMGVLAIRIFGKFVSGYGKSRQEFRTSQSNIMKRFFGIIYDDIICFPDPEWPWYVFGGFQACNFAKKHKPDILFSSAPPFSSHLLAAYIKKRLNIPWVADYRDLWSSSPFYSTGQFSCYFRKKLEQKIFHCCNGLATVSKPMADHLASISHKPVQVVTNGFDFKKNDAYPLVVPNSWKTCQTNLLYTGMIYPGFQDIGPLISAVYRLKRISRIQKGDLLVWLFGPNTHVVQPLINKFGVESFFKIRSSIPHRKAIALQKRACLLLFLEWNDEREKGIFTSKFFEYLGAGKPILGIGPKGGVVDDTLKETGTGIMENDSIAISKSLLYFMRNKTLPGQIGPYCPGLKKFASFRREYQTQILAQLFTKIILSS